MDATFQLDVFQQLSTWQMVLLGLAVALVLDLLWMNLESSASRKTIRLPFIGDLIPMLKNFDNVHQWINDFYFQSSTPTAKAQSIMIARNRFWCVVHPMDVQHMLKTNWKNYVISQGLRGESVADLLGDGIFAVDGEEWYHQRKTVSREFTMNNFRNFMLGVFSHYAQVLKAQLLDAADKGETVDMHQKFFRLTLDSFGKVGFGVDLGGLAGTPVAFGGAFDDAQEICARRLANKPPLLWKTERLLQVGDEKRMTKNLATIQEFVKDLCEDRQKKRDAEIAQCEKEGTTPGFKDMTDNAHQDLFSRLFHVSETDAKLQNNPEARVKYLRDMTVNFMIAGRDTTACALSWAVYELCKHPEAEAKLVQELQDCVPIPDKLSYDDLAPCHYLTSFAHEVLRLHPSVPLDPKYAIKDDVLPYSNVKIRAGDNVAFTAFSMARSTEIWGLDACEFKPERWLSNYQPPVAGPDGSAVAQPPLALADGERPTFVKADQYKYPVFQAGPRVCLGVDMALLEIKAVLVALYSSCKFQLQAEPKIRTTLVLQMTHEGLQTTVKRR